MTHVVNEKMGSLWCPPRSGGMSLQPQGTRSLRLAGGMVHLDVQNTGVRMATEQSAENSTPAGVPIHRNTLRRINQDEVRASIAAFDARCAELRAGGQQLFARIRPSSKYFGQGKEGELFSAVITADAQYQVQGGPGGCYRLADVDLFAKFQPDQDPVQFTFEQA